MTRRTAKRKAVAPIKIATCITCDKRWEGPNAHGVGAIHARKHKHRVGVEVTFFCFYEAKLNDGNEKLQIKEET